MTSQHETLVRNVLSRHQNKSYSLLRELYQELSQDKVNLQHCIKLADQIIASTDRKDLSAKIALASVNDLKENLNQVVGKIIPTLKKNLGSAFGKLAHFSPQIDGYQFPDDLSHSWDSTSSGIAREKLDEVFNEGERSRKGFWADVPPDNGGDYVLVDFFHEVLTAFKPWYESHVLAQLWENLKRKVSEDLVMEVERSKRLSDPYTLDEVLNSEQIQRDILGRDKHTLRQIDDELAYHQRVLSRDRHGSLILAALKAGKLSVLPRTLQNSFKSGLSRSQRRRRY